MWSPAESYACVLKHQFPTSVRATLRRLRELLVLRQSHVPELLSVHVTFNPGQLVLPSKLDQDGLHGEVPFPLS